MNMRESSCIFCKIVSREITTEIVTETANTLAFWDIAPLAKVHLLIIPKQHYRDVSELVEKSPETLSELLKSSTDLARGFTRGSFKLQFNTGAEAGQTVFHAHAHVISDSPKDGS
jgi:histidine triad (HIT) family protein